MRAHGFRRCFTPLPGCFSPFPHGTGPLSVTGECLALEGGPPCFPPGFTCPAVLRQRPREGPGGGYGALALSRPPSHARSPRRALCDSRRPARGPDGRASTPAGQRPRARKRPPVWAGPLSLAATRGVSFDFLSSGYLDVSVPPVAAGSPPQPACAGWVPPFGHPRIRGRVRLPGDYRGLPRPSSASCAKASAARPYYLRFPLGFQVTILKNQMVMDSHIALHRDRRCDYLAPRLAAGLGNRIVFDL